MPAKIVDNEEGICEIIELFCGQDTVKPFMFVDLEGVNLGRHGTISIMQILVPPTPLVFLIDVIALGEKAFTTTEKGGRSLRNVLENKRIGKVFFNVRMDSDALFAHSGVKLKGVIDVQLLEFTTRAKPYKKLNGLRRCIEWEGERGDLPLYSKEILKKKEEGAKLFKAEEGGSYDVFLERPLPQAIIDYCEVDVLMLPGLLQLYASRTGGDQLQRIQQATQKRVVQSQAVDFVKSPNGADGPGELMTKR